MTNAAYIFPRLFQVGGHTRLMVLNPQTICKPLNYRELDFYQNIQDQDIKLFVPKYKGKLSNLRCGGDFPRETLVVKCDDDIPVKIPYGQNFGFG